MSEEGFLLRKAVRNLTEPELSNMRLAYEKMMQIKDNRGYAHYAKNHGVSDWLCWHGPKTVWNVPDARLFLPWHRAYLYRFEQALQDQIPDVTIPWWDWRAKQGQDDKIPEAFAVEEVNGNRNPLYKFFMNVPNSNPPLNRYTIRFPGIFDGTSNPPTLPSSESIENIIKNRSNFDDFSDSIENIHGLIHVWTGGRKSQNGQMIFGDMGSVATAAFDPIFWSHHCMIDRLWWIWQMEHGTRNIPSVYLDLVLEPFDLTVRDVLDIYDLGYDYAGIEKSVGGTN